MRVVTGPDNPEEIISRLILHHEKDLLRLCCAYLKDVALAEDAVQETFLKAYRHLDTFRGDSSARTWLVRIAINVCKDMRRGAWFRMIRNAVELDAVQIASPEGNHEIRSALAAEIMRLPASCREVILLHYYEGFTQTEIADALHVSPAAVHRRLSKAYGMLRNALEGGDCFHEAAQCSR